MVHPDTYRRLLPCETYCFSARKWLSPDLVVSHENEHKQWSIFFKPQNIVSVSLLWLLITTFFLAMICSLCMNMRQGNISIGKVTRWTLKSDWTCTGWTALYEGHFQCLSTFFQEKVSKITGCIMLKYYGVLEITNWINWEVCNEWQFWPSYLYFCNQP